MKIVVNRSYGGFSLSPAQSELFGCWEFGYPCEDEARTNPILIQSVEDGLNKEHSVVEIPDNVHWEINEYDGAESIVWSESEIHWV